MWPMSPAEERSSAWGAAMPGQKVAPSTVSATDLPTKQIKSVEREHATGIEPRMTSLEGL